MTYREYTFGQMGVSMKDIGRKTTCMDKAFTHGQTVESTTATTIWTRSMVMEFTTGKTEESTRDSGQVEGSMAKEGTPHQMEKYEEVFGGTENELDGSMKVLETRRLTLKNSVLF